MALAQRIGVRIRLRPLAETEVADFLDGHMRAAGAATPLFDAQATATLFHHSRGIPRLVQNLALASAMAAMAAGVTQIDQALVQQAVVDLEDL